MIWQDTGFLLVKNKYNENAAIAEFYTKNHGKVTGVIFGATSRKIKNYLLIGNKFHINFNSKNENKIGYFNIEIEKINTPIFIENNKKLSCITYSLNLLKLLTVENQENKKIFFLLDDLFEFLQTENWILKFIHWELDVFNTLGYNINFIDYVDSKKIGEKDIFYLKTNHKRIIPNFLINKNYIKPNKNDLLIALKIVGDFLDKSILKPNNINHIASRTGFVNTVK